MQCSCDMQLNEVLKVCSFIPDEETRKYDFNLR